jgi:ribonuclease Z
MSVAKCSDKRTPIVALAFDHASMTIGDMWKMGHYMPAIEQSFCDTVEERDEEQEVVIAEMDGT